MEITGNCIRNCRNGRNIKYIWEKIEEKTVKANTEENRQFRILSAFGFIFAVAGHLGYGAFDMGGLFPYYSFHVFIFLFVGLF